jgi:hypothetical protein
MTHAFSTGDTVYLESGERALFVCAHGQGFIVEPLYGEDEEEFPDGVKSADRVYAEPPVAKKSEDIIRLDAKIDEKRNELHALQAEVRAAQKEQGELRKRLSVHAALARVDDWLAGRMTHFVKISEYERIEPVTKAELLKEEDRSSDLRLVCLFGKTDGNLQWRVNRWRDGSGSWTDILPFANYEDAFTFCAAEIPKRLETADDGYRRDNLVESARKLGLAIDQRHIDEARARRVAAAQKNLDSALSGVAELRKKLGEAQS